jgi:hypothetical protein
MDTSSSSQNIAILGLAHLLQAVGAVPALISMMESQQTLILALRQDVTDLLAKQKSIAADGWLDAQGAMVYLAGMAPATFDRYRYCKINPIPGHKLNGKVYYKPSEIDRWMKLYSAG